MNNKKFLFFITIMLAAILISGCGDKDKKDSDEKEEPETEVDDKNSDEEKDNEDEEDEKDEEDPKDEEDLQTSNGFEELINYMEKETEGTANILYENNEEQTHEMDDFSVSLDEYTLIELHDFNPMFEIPFNDQTDGGVLITKYTVTNDTDEDAYYMPFMSASYTGATKAFDNYKDLLPEEEQLPIKLTPSNDYLIEAGESITGYYTYPFGEDQLEDLLAEGALEIEVPAPHEDKGDVNSTFGKDGKFNLSITEDGEEKTSSAEEFYEDRVTYENMGEKEMIDAKDNINESEEIGDFTVTLDGYQFTEFTPNDEEAPRFESFDTGLVLLTVQFDIENNHSSEIGNNSISSKLTVNDGAQYMLNEGMLLGYRNDDVIESGESGELLQVYALDKEQYEKIWKDKSFELEIGPMKDADAKDISKGKKASFSF